MALIDVIKYEGQPGEVVWKFPRNDISTFGQLVVNESQEAVFFKEGKALDVFGAGTHTLKTGNVPILEKLVNLPFGGQTPFTAEVVYINKALIQLKWGTPAPVQVEDPKYMITLGLRANGSYNIKITDSKAFAVGVVGSRGVYTQDQVDSFLRPMIVTRLSDFLAEVVLKSGEPITKLNQYLEEASSAGKTKVQPDFSKYGIEVVDFFVQSINFDQNDPNFQKIQKVLTDKFEIETLGGMYQQKRMLDIGEAAAKNESGNAGQGMSAGLGLGMGMNMGNMMSGMAAGQNNAGAANNQNDASARLQKLKSMLDQGLISQEEFDAKKKDILNSI
ncbi:SPFH domain-containing protein [Leptospira semungkisensis]|uniref:SPFH domain-containing protein n=1 Tax=Leptospira semungkisensis TaxID=2484985 RepID=A0A4R9G8Q9_9LEPT|nr:SPFH domain-containing protein [Leptospira semungkisensis]TGK07430.1 SPFH domain-containing protein [Leptospira semungkisensis]